MNALRALLDIPSLNLESDYLEDMRRPCEVWHRSCPRKVRGVSTVWLRELCTHRFTMDTSRLGDGCGQHTSKGTQPEGQREQREHPAVTILCPVRTLVSTPHAQLPKRRNQVVPASWGGGVETATVPLSGTIHPHYTLSSFPFA